MSKTVSLLVVFLAMLSLADFSLAHPGHDHAQGGGQPAGVRTWTGAKGVFKVEASFVAARDGQVQLRKKDGTLITRKIELLSQNDQTFIQQRLAEIRHLHETKQEFAMPLIVENRPVSNPLGDLLALAPQAGVASDAPEMAKAFEPFAKLKALSYHWDDKYFYVESNGIPNHPMMIGIRAWQQQVPLPQKYVGDNAWQIPLHPVPAKQPASAKGRFLRGAIALAANGIPIFNPLNNRGDDAFLFGELDEFGGHCGRGDDYHYHLAPVHLEKQVGKGGIIGYALDGYPIYGFDERDGSKVANLDALNGHKDKDGNYHYHATKTYPYLNGGFYGEVVERDGQVDPQPRAQPIRAALPPMRGAKIVGFTSPKASSYSLTYEVAGKKGHVNYTVAADGSAAFEFMDTAGKITKENYTPRRPPLGGDRPPPPRANETAQNSPPAIRSDVTKLTVTSAAFEPNGNFPVEFTCDGAGVSPPVEWSGVPSGTKFFAVSLWHIAPDQEKSYWVVYNIPANVTKLEKNSKSVGKMGLNDKRRADYDPMCSKGPGVKKYHISVYALSAEVKLPPDKANRAGLLAAIKDTTLAEGVLTYNYERSKSR